ncbi:HAD family hydrolase [Salinicoccus sesuvii]
MFFNTYSKKHQEYVLPNLEIISMLNALKEKGYKLGIFTGKSSKSLEISLHSLDLEDLFDCKLTGDDVTKPKPHPEGIRKVLNLLGSNSDETIFLGDSDADIISGKQAGVYTIGVHWLPNIQTAQFSVQPDIVFEDISEFLNYFPDSI